jgi:hypothetical protein
MLTFLQLSDIHFRGEGGGGAEAQDYDQRESLIADARQVGEHLGGYSAILVAGDIAGSGSREQFAQASSWLRNLCLAVDLKPWMVWTVPGNHDIDRRRISELGHEFRERIWGGREEELEGLFAAMLDEEEGAATLLAPLENYIEFADAFDCAFNRARLHWTSDIEIAAKTPLQMRGMSSALLCAQKDDTDRHRMMVGERQCEKWDIGYVHLNMCHHPQSWLLDRGLEGALADNAHVRVTGHLHRRKLEWTPIGAKLEAGAVSPTRLEDGNYQSGCEPSYDVVSLLHSDEGAKRQLEIAVHPRRWQEGAWGEGQERRRRFTLGQPGVFEEVAARPAGTASVPERPERELRYQLAQLPLTDKYGCLEAIGAPVARFMDLDPYFLVSEIWTWAEENGRIDALREAIASDEDNGGE